MELHGSGRGTVASVIQCPAEVHEALPVARGARRADLDGGPRLPSTRAPVPRTGWSGQRMGLVSRPKKSNFEEANIQRASVEKVRLMSEKTSEISKISVKYWANSGTRGP